MDGLRLVTTSGQSPLSPCCRCDATGCPWDRIGSCPICPDCQENLALGEAEPLIQRLTQNQCLVCNKRGTVPYMTWPLHGRDPLAIDLCPAHFHDFLGRRLDRFSYRTLNRALQGFGMNVKQIFLLHEAFYDERGHPLQPVPEP
ncbi:MAG: hypothetical protein U0840_07500 [Gemmataceae bacterium]